jgi:hypothetical protein
MSTPATWKRNDLTDAMDAIANRNRASGSVIGSRIKNPINHNLMEVPGLDEDLAKIPVTAPEQLPEITDEEHERRLVAFMGGAHAPSTGLVPIEASKWTSPNSLSLSDVDFSDLRSIDFTKRSIIVGGLPIPLDEYSYEQLAIAASNALQRSISNVAQMALKRLLPVVHEPKQEEVQSVLADEAPAGILDTPKKEGWSATVV